MSRPASWTPEAVALHRAGWTHARLAQRYGVSPSAVQQRLIRAEVYGSGMPRATMERRCLCCQDPFVSTGAGHRLCDRCKRANAWAPDA